MPYLLIVLCDVSQVVATSIMRLAHRHRVMCEIDVAVVTEEFRHGRDVYEENSGRRKLSAVVGDTRWQNMGKRYGLPSIRAW